MIDFRYHVVSIIAVFLALTVGLVLGASFLPKAQVDFLNGQITSANNAKNRLETKQFSLSADNQHMQDYIDGTKDNLVNNQLFNDAVVVVRAAGYDPGAVNSVLALTKQAAATITADITVNPTFADPSSVASLQDLVANYAPLGQKVPGGDPVAQAINLLVEALTVQSAATGAAAGSASASPAASPSASATPNAVPAAMTAAWAVRTVQAFKSIGVISVTVMPSATNPVKPTAAFMAAPLDPAPDPQNSLYLSLAQALRAAGAGPVIGGSAPAAGAGGLITAVLKDAAATKTVSTVDDTDSTIGQVAVVFVLYGESRNAAAPAGHYGTTGTTDGPLPKLPKLLPAPSPSAS
ncbi:copper transporter [Actinocrinis puniceicyclus]|uniref:Copper transporter n=1 Tax=Actinocrinis puniceicyclus TaxID=977794 RepID=A0A8J7WNS8_9ACTN|nr:copper transporter [Actinocrinis puniceicyclus]MBS2964698.1 copper transporter [Actinocrinis puniceicyclus]